MPTIAYKTVSQYNMAKNRMFLCVFIHFKVKEKGGNSITRNPPNQVFFANSNHSVNLLLHGTHLSLQLTHWAALLNK